MLLQNFLFNFPLKDNFGRIWELRTFGFFPWQPIRKNIAEKKTPWVAFCVFFISLVEFLENLYGDDELHSTLGRLRHVTKRHPRRERGILRLKCLCGRHARVSWQLKLFLVEQKTFRMLHQRCDPVALTEDYMILKHFRSYLNPWGNDPIYLIFFEWVETAELDKGWDGQWGTFFRLHMFYFFLWMMPWKGAHDNHEWCLTKKCFWHQWPPPKKQETAQWKNFRISMILWISSLVRF